MPEVVKGGDNVSSIMTKEVLTVDSSETVRAALKRMREENVGSLIVTEAGKAVGVITERDIARLCGEKSDLGFLEGKVKPIMKSPLIKVGPQTLVWDALEVMLNRSIRRLPVMRNDELLGIITERNIMLYVLKVAYEPSPPENLRKLIEKLEKHEKL
jgi:CBS domain-containing protein